MTNPFDCPSYNDVSLARNSQRSFDPQFSFSHLLCKRSPMLVRSEPVSRLAPTFTDNLCRWDGRSAPHYEVWFLTLNHRESQRGFWFRYTVEAPTGPPSARPSAALWAAVFNRRSP